MISTFAEALPLEPIVPPSYEEASAPPAYIYHAADAVQESAPSTTRDSYNNSAYQVDHDGNMYAIPNKK